MLSPSLSLPLSLSECVTLKGTFLYSVLIQTDLRWHRGFSEALLDYLFMVGGWNASASPDLPSYTVSQLLITSLPPNTTHLQFKAAKPISIAGYITISINIITIFKDEESLRGMRAGVASTMLLLPKYGGSLLESMTLARRL